MQINRLYFIDAVRAFAILMMLQGHFIDTLLAVEFRDPNNLAYTTWRYFRGITAPVFFTISGLIFTYLLIKAKEKGTLRHRMRKGVIRGLMLIGIGYALRIPIFRWFTGSFGTYFLVIDVLQCIGLSLILIVCIYAITQKKALIFSIVMLCLGTIIFLTEPLYRNYAAEGVPLAIANYFTKDNGSVFTIIPWFGYMTYGAFIATLFYGYLIRPKFKTAIVSGFFGVGFGLIYGSTPLIHWLALLTDFSLFIEVANYNYLFIRLGNVLLLFGLFYALETYLKHPTILKIGQKTLSIYIIHFILLYGSFTGWGLNRIFGKNLTPFEAIIGAFCFLVTVSLISIYIIKANTQVYGFFRQKAYKIKVFIQSLNT
ncbi:MAG: heparan-alpha-glucosaminide N-acetyltransferase domain-containing protein [Flavobacteriaceae bacterium]|nr:heparan-alpha-glucosaminide N-acetyltransferase domain-containing protein [Flavobacteriaceae bacterium]